MKNLLGCAGVIIFGLTLAITVEAAEYKIDPVKNCFFLNQNENLKEKGVKIPLKLNASYTLTLSGDAFFSNESGANADPMPGVVIFYSTNNEDGFDSEYTVLRKTETMQFTTPKADQENVFLIAFVLDHWPGSNNTGFFTLNVSKK